MHNFEQESPMLPNVRWHRSPEIMAKLCNHRCHTREEFAALRNPQLLPLLTAHDEAHNLESTDPQLAAVSIIISNLGLDKILQSSDSDHQLPVKHHQPEVKI